MIQIVKKKAKKNLPMGGFKKWQRHTLPGITLVPSAQIGLTSLFGMGRGGPYCNSHRTLNIIVFQIYNNHKHITNCHH